MEEQKRRYNSTYVGEYARRVAFPLGGIGAGMVCLEGAGALSHVSLRGRPDVFNEPLMFGALHVKGRPHGSRVLEGPVPRWKVFFPWGGSAGNGAGGKSYGLPRFAGARFRARFPFGVVELEDCTVPLVVDITGWSPFVPGDADSSSLPVAALEYCFANATGEPIEAVFSFHASNFMSTDAPGEEVRSVEGGFVLFQPESDEEPFDRGAFSVTTPDSAARSDCAWFRGEWFDSLSMVWKAVSEGAVIDAGPVTDGGPSPGGSLYVPFRLRPGAEKVIRLQLSWYAPETGLRCGPEPEDAHMCESGCCAEGDERPPTYRPWYAGVFEDVIAVARYWREHYRELRDQTVAFSDCFYDSTLPPEVIEAVSANLSILKTPTVLRQTDGRLWCWEGCHDRAGCCHGSCTHVWNYAQALPHLFPELERSLRATEFNESQDDTGHQDFRASLPIRPTAHDFAAAADGQLGGIVKVYREWRISGDTGWLRRLWPLVRQSLHYCIETWDPGHRGLLEEPHLSTYDVEFSGPDGMCTSFYLGALRAAAAMAEALGEFTPLYRDLYEKGRAFVESELWNGEYFVQKVEWRDLEAGDPARRERKSIHISYSPEARVLLEEEGPKYQYGNGCLSDGVLGAWMAAVCGLGDVLDPAKVAGHLLAVHRYNLRRDLSHHANPQRPTYALGEEGGLLLCSWPRGGAQSLPFVYSNEVWTGIEYQVASHLMMLGHVEEGLEIVRIARDRYDGRTRNPFDEYECGHWYARALSSYGLLQGLTGIRYDALAKTLYIEPGIEGDFRSFFCTATGYGTVGIQDGEPWVEVVRGNIPYEKVVYRDRN